MRNFADRLTEAIAAKNNPTVMGLDPKLEYIPDSIIEKANSLFDDPARSTAEAILMFNKGLIDAVCDIIPAVKPQSAFYELYGIEGMRALDATIEYAQSKGLLVILDAKRNDIGNTAQAYATGLLGKTQIADGSFVSMTGADAVTVNGYLGKDGIAPFIEVSKEEDSGIFCLVRTSNPSAGDLQDLELKDGRLVYKAMAELVNEWGQELIGESGFSSVGAVVGATWPEQAVEARALMPNAIILVPGYGAQGAGPDAAVASFTADGKGSIVNASRSLMCAWKAREGKTREDFMECTREEAIDMRDKLNAALADRKYV